MVTLMQRHRPLSFILSAERNAFERVTLLGGFDGAGFVEAGSVLGRITATGKYAISPADADDGSETATVILADTVDIRSGDAMGFVIIGHAALNFHELVFDASVADDAAKASKIAQLAAASVAVGGSFAMRGAPVADAGGGEGAPEWLPDGAIGFADFANGYYYAGGAEVSAAEVLSSTSNIVPSTGLVMDGETSTTLSLLGPIATALIAGDFTVVVELDATTAVSANPILVVNAADDGNEVLYFLYSTASGLRRGAMGDYGDTVSRDIEPLFGEGSAPGLLRVAMTRTDDRLSFSQNGADVVTDTTAYEATPSAMQALIGGFAPDDPTEIFTVKSITLYASRPDVDLPALAS